jgi:flagellar hook-associated protein 1 FlgK
MSGLFGNLTSASSALQAHGKSVELSGKNIANINNPDYARQRVVSSTLSTVASGEVNSFVDREVQNLRDAFVDKQVIEEGSFLSSFETRDNRLREILGALGETMDRVSDPSFISDLPEDNGGIRDSLNDFLNAFENFAANPSDRASRSIVVQSAQELVGSLNRADARLDAIETSIDTEIQTEVKAFNNRMSELSDMNRQIARIETAAGEGAAADLRNARQALLEDMAEFAQADVETVADSNGQVALRYRTESGETVDLLRPGFSPEPLLYDSASNVFRVASSAENLDLRAGKLAALSQVKSDDLVEVRGRLDALANTVATEVNELYYQAFVPAGADPAVPELSFFAQPTPPPSVSGVASSVDVGSIALYTGSSDPLVTDSQPLDVDSLRSTDSAFAGANELALAIAGLSQQKFASLDGLSFSEAIIQTTVDLGQQIQSNDNQLAVQRDVELMMKDRQAQVSGVSLEEEMSNLVQYQRAFQASSQVFQVVSEMLETVVNLR